MIKRFYKPEEKLAFDEPPIDGGRYLRQWNMTVPIGHSKDKYVNIFFEASRSKIRAKFLSDLAVFRILKFMITLRIKLHREKPDGSVDYAEPHLYPINQLVLRDSNELKDLLNTSLAQIQEALERWTHNGSGWIVVCVVSMNINKISTLERWLVFSTTEIHN